MYEPPLTFGRLSDDDWAAALERIEHESALLPQRSDAGPGPQREEPRVERRLRCTMRVQDDNGEHAVFLVGTRNLSRGGVSVLHGTHLDEGTTAVLALEAEDGFGTIVPATVAWCRRVGAVGYEGVVAYEVGMKFTTPLRLETYLDAA